MDLPNSAHQWQDGNSHAKTTNVPNINAVDTSASQTAHTPPAPKFFCRRALGRADFAGARFVIEYLKDWKTFRPSPLPVSSTSAMMITAAANLCATGRIDRKGGAHAERCKRKPKQNESNER